MKPKSRAPVCFLFVCRFFVPSFSIFVEGFVRIVWGKKVVIQGIFLQLEGRNSFFTQYTRGFVH